MTKPPRMEINVDSIPLEIRQQPKWICWKWEVRNGKWTKPPFDFKNGKFAKSNDPNTWGDFFLAYKASLNGKYDGIGFMLSADDPYSGVDWDDCHSDGVITPEAEKEIMAFNSYTEYSPSGKGLKTLVKGKLPGPGHHDEFFGVFDNTRYFCITGKKFDKVSASIEDRQMELDIFYQKRWGKKPNGKTVSKMTDNRSIIEKALDANDGGKFARLWDGQIAEYSSASEADLALCSKLAWWTNSDPALVDALFRQSGLMREKWERDDYRNKTIDKACGTQAEGYRRTYNNTNTHIEYRDVDFPGGSQQGQQGQQRSTLGVFHNEDRFDRIYRIAIALMKGGIPGEEIKQYLSLLSTHFLPPVSDDEMREKILGILTAEENESVGLTESIREIIGQHEGYITSTDCLQWSTRSTSPSERRKITTILGRMVKEGLLRKSGRKAGEYQIIAKEHEVQDWKNASMESVKMVFPLGLHEAVRVVPGSIIMFAGVTNTGKTAMAMNIARLNCRSGTIKYLTSEIEQDEFRQRIEAYCKNNNDTIDKWDVELIAKFIPTALPHLINPDGINIIDYLEPPVGDFTQIVPLITDIHHALKTGIVIINIQKKTGDEYGSGGQYVRNKAHLFCTLDVTDYPVCKLEIKKCKAPNHGYRNPVGCWVEYAIDVKDGLTVKPMGKINFTKWRD